MFYSLNIRTVPKKQDVVYFELQWSISQAWMVMNWSVLFLQYMCSYITFKKLNAEYVKKMDSKWYNFGSVWRIVWFSATKVVQCLLTVTYFTFCCEAKGFLFPLLAGVKWVLFWLCGTLAYTKLSILFGELSLQLVFVGGRESSYTRGCCWL